MIRFPQRPASHVTGDEAVRLFVAACPAEWLVSPVTPDYGLDLRVEISRSGQVTGEEFYVQVKGRRSVDSKKPVAKVRQSTINYWLGKLNPTMIVVADIPRQQFWFDWLEIAYHEYPVQRNGEDEVTLPLPKSSAKQSLLDEARQYVATYFSRLRRDIAALAETGQLSKLLLHVSTLARTCGRTALILQQKEGTTQEELKEVLYWFFLEFGLHDQFLWSLWEKDSEWRRPISPGAYAIMGPLLEKYVACRGKFWMREQRQEAGDFCFVPVRYSALLENILPALFVLWELEEVLTQLLVLGRVVIPTLDNESSVS